MRKHLDFLTINVPGDLTGKSPTLEPRTSRVGKSCIACLQLRDPRSPTPPHRTRLQALFPCLPSCCLQVSRLQGERQGPSRQEGIHKIHSWRTEPHITILEVDAFSVSLYITICLFIYQTDTY